MILSGTPVGAGVWKWNTFAAVSNPNTFGAGLQYSVMSSVIMEVVITALFLIVIMGATSKRAPAGFAPIAIGLSLALFHFVSIPVTNASLNPARSTATAIFGGPQALSNLPIFWIAPIVGGIIGGIIAKWLHNE